MGHGLRAGMSRPMRASKPQCSVGRQALLHCIIGRSLWTQDPVDAGSYMFQSYKDTQGATQLLASSLV